MTGVMACLLPILLGQLLGRFAVPLHHPRIAHFMPYLLGDSLDGLRRAKLLGFHYVDQNAHADAQGRAWVLHWRRYRMQFGWIATGRTDKAGHEVRVRVPASWPRYIDQLDSDQVARLRSARHGGRRPHLVRQHMAAAAGLGLVLCLEAKGSPGFLVADTWAALGQHRDETGADVIVMTLQNQGGNAKALRRLQLAHDVGRFPVALLPRGHRPADWFTHWQPLGVRVWGKFK